MKLPRFSLRTMFVLVTIACLLASWSIYNLKWINDRHKIRMQGGAYEFIPPLKGQDPALPPFALRIFGEWFLYAVAIEAPMNATDEELERVQRLYPEFEVRRATELRQHERVEREMSK